jgi:hypothetical protein
MTEVPSDRSTEMIRRAGQADKRLPALPAKLCRFSSPQLRNTGLPSPCPSPQQPPHEEDDDPTESKASQPEGPNQPEHAVFVHQPPVSQTNRHLDPGPRSHRESRPLAETEEGGLQRSFTFPVPLSDGHVEDRAGGR